MAKIIDFPDWAISSKNEKKDAKVINLADNLKLRAYALEQGYSIKDYLRKGREKGLSKDDLIKYAKKGKSLESIAGYRKRRKIIKKIAFNVSTGTVLAYALNFLITIGVTNASLSDGFKRAHKDYNAKRERIVRLEKSYRELRKDGNGMADVMEKEIYRSRMEARFHSIHFKYGGEKIKHWMGEQKAINPFNHWKYRSRKKV